jgi:hypothetical protein
MQQQQTYTHTEHEQAVLNKFRKRLEREKYINNYASNYYGSLQLRFTIPGILITGISSVASFLATSDLLTDGTKAGFSIGVGILTAGATILQSVSSSFGFGARKDAFQKSADCYDDLITKIEFEICNPNESFSEFCNDLEEAILKIKNDCAFLPPLFVMAKYEAELAKANIRLDGGSPSKSLTFDEFMSSVKPNVQATLPMLANPRPNIHKSDIDTTVNHELQEHKTMIDILPHPDFTILELNANGNIQDDDQTKNSSDV